MEDDENIIMRSPTLQTTASPTLAPEEITTKPSPPVGLCALSVNPQEDTDINKNSGFRFGMSIAL